MDNNKGQTIFLSVIGIATLLVAIIGATFAWFSVNVQGNDTASSIIVTTAVLGSITFEDGSLISLSNIRPETENLATKTFTIANTYTDLTRPIQYYIDLVVTENTLSAVVNGVTGGDFFVHSVTGSEEKDANDTDAPNGTLVTTGGFVGVPTVGTTRLGSQASAGAVDTGIIQGAAVHRYTYSIDFNDSGSNQNSGQGKSFNGYLQVHTTDNGSSVGE